LESFVDIYSLLESHQGVLIYSKNRLIRRLENPKLGNLDFLSSKSLSVRGEQQQHHHPVFETEGFIELKAYFKPNIFKTVRLDQRENHLK